MSTHDPRPAGLLRRFRPYLRFLAEVRAPLLGALAFAIVYGVANGAGLPLMAKYVFPRIFPSQDAGVAVEALTRWEVLAVALWLPVVFLVRGLSGYGNTYLIQLAGVRVLEALRLAYFRKLQVLPLSFLQRQTSGDLISRGLADTNQLQATLTSVANELFKQPATLLMSIGVLGWLAYHERGVGLVLASLAIVPACVFPIRYVGRKLLARAAAVQAGLGSVTDRFAENLAAAREVRAFGLEAREEARFAAVTRALVRAQMKVVKYAHALAPAIEILSSIGIAITFIYAHELQVPLESFLAIIFALYASYEPIKKLGNVNNDLRRGLAALDRLEVVLDEPVRLADAPDARPLDRATGAIAFEGARFGYGHATPALVDVSVTIPAGTICALVGPSGAGKSTFAHLVPRFHDVDAGAVRLDGVDVRAFRLADLRRNIALVSQDPVLFNDTVLANLLIGRPEATRAEVEAAARAAFAHDFILEMPHGYDSTVGERGSGLSGGQRQRIALARAFLRDAPIIILDEATSALDAESEAVIQEALGRLVRGKTVLIIAHRFSTIRNAGLILVFDQGRIVASGDHPSLLRDNPLYRGLYERQR